MAGWPFDELYREVQSLPEGWGGEIVPPGMVRAMARPGAPHRFLAFGLRDWLEHEDGLYGRRRWWFETEVELKLRPEDMDPVLLVPDLSGWRLGADTPLPPPWTDDNPIERRPDWVCEVLSPTTRTYDTQVKFTLYEKCRVPWLWLVEPTEHWLEAYRLTEQGRYERAGRFADDDHEPVPPFEDVPLPLGRMWRPRPAKR